MKKTNVIHTYSKVPFTKDILYSVDAFTVRELSASHSAMNGMA